MLTTFLHAMRNHTTPVWRLVLPSQCGALYKPPATTTTSTTTLLLLARLLTQLSTLKLQFLFYIAGAADYTCPCRGVWYCTSSVTCCVPTPLLAPKLQVMYRGVKKSPLTAAGTTQQQQPKGSVQKDSPKG